MNHSQFLVYFAGMLHGLQGAKLTSPVFCRAKRTPRMSDCTRGIEFTVPLEIAWHLP